MPDSVAERGGICLCGAIDWSLIFGGRKPAYFLCGMCSRRYDLDGVLIQQSAARQDLP